MAANNVTTVLDGYEPYERYRRLGVLPMGIGPFAQNPAGEPILHLGEVRCRVLLAPGALCGSGPYSRLGNLKNHLFWDHGLRAEAAGRVGLPTSHLIIQEKVFWGNVMNAHDLAAAPLLAAQANIIAAQAMVPQPPPWHVVLLPNGALDLMRMHAACVTIPGRVSPCESCVADAEIGEEEELDECNYFRLGPHWLCENRDLWIELAAEDNAPADESDSSSSDSSSSSDEDEGDQDDGGLGGGGLGDDGLGDDDEDPFFDFGGDDDLDGDEDDEQPGNGPPPPPSSDSDSDDEELEEDQVAGYGFPPLPAPGFDAEGVEPPSSEVSSSSPEPSSESSYDSESD
ncbi:hypothetical protein HBH98_255210 [Parastagonospora nodorum]|nr:hypothetical protein HBH98_255210 [Parastagonospora nodorum]KAH4354249.1 hypothetical protein HBH97_253550 [Parastagonospora nodorum]KAH4365861.1 hypothetical protein HBH99_255050 [Parastagonospora nodorum]